MKFTSGCKDRKGMDKLFMLNNNTPRLGQAGHGGFMNSYGSTHDDRTSLSKLIKEKNYGY